jgi:UDPglucose 6-dehydrogenase
MRNFEDLQIAVAGTGYVGLSIATLLAQHHKVTAVDIIPEKVEKIRRYRTSILKNTSQKRNSTLLQPLMEHPLIKMQIL